MTVRTPKEYRMAATALSKNNYSPYLVPQVVDPDEAKVMYRADTYFALFTEALEMMTTEQRQAFDKRRAFMFEE